MTLLKVKEVCHCFGEHIVLNHINLEIKAGEFVALVGPSGCGKSTLFRAILGTHPPSFGSICMEGRGEINTPCRDVGIVYQNYSLYEFLTAKENVAFGPLLDRTTLPFRIFQFWKWRKLYKTFLKDSIALLDRMELADFVEQYPKSLSGGMRQRVAIAQALIMQPKILLLDEPLGALDEATREELQRILLELYAENLEAKKVGITPPHTMILVTHELNEAFYIADRVVGLSQYHAKGFPGATIVYDQPAPVYAPNDPRNFGIFFDQKEELRKVVFDGKILVKGDEYIYHGK